MRGMLKPFFEKALQTNGLHFLLTSQKVPEFVTRADIEKLEISDLPDDFALEFLQKEGARSSKPPKLIAGWRKLAAKTSKS